MDDSRKNCSERFSGVVRQLHASSHLIYVGLCRVDAVQHDTGKKILQICINQRKKKNRKKRAPKFKTTSKSSCVICKHKTCIDEKHCAYSVRVTRRMTKILQDIKEFVIIETYRCMPLLGDEQEIVPDWDVHIVRYTVVFKEKKKHLVLRFT